LRFVARGSIYLDVGAGPCVRPRWYVVRSSWCVVTATGRPRPAARIGQNLPPLGEGWVGVVALQEPDV